LQSRGIGEALYLVLSQMEKKLARRLVGFAELQMGSCHATETH